MDDQILRIRLLAESNLSQVMDKDAAAVLRAQGMLEKLAQEQTKNNAALRRFEEERAQIMQAYGAKMDALLGKNVDAQRKHHDAETALYDKAKKAELQHSETIRRIREQRERELEQHRKKLIAIQKREDAEAGPFAQALRNVGQMPSSPERDAENKRSADRLQSLRDRMEAVERAYAMRIQDLNVAVEAEARRHNDAMAQITQARVSAQGKSVEALAAVDQAEIAERVRHANALTQIEQQALNEQNRIEQGKERQRQKSMRHSMQTSFGAFGIALGAQSLLRAFQEGTGQQAPPVLKAMASGLSTVSDAMLTGSVMHEKYGSAVGGMVGVVLAATAVMNSYGEEVQQADAALEQLARKDDTIDTISRILGVTKEETQVMMDAAKANGEYAQSFNQLFDLKKKNFWQENIADPLLNSPFGGMLRGIANAPDMNYLGLGLEQQRLRAYLQAQEAGNKLNTELQKEAALVVRLQTIWETTQKAADDYYKAVEKGARAAAKENEQFAKTIQDLNDDLLKAQQDYNKVMGGTGFGRERGLEGSEGTGTAYKELSDAKRAAERDYADAVKQANDDAAEYERQTAFERETIARELAQRKKEIEYDLAQQLAGIQHDLMVAEATAYREFYDKAADQAWQYQQQVAQLNYDALKNEQQYQWDLSRLNEQAAVDRAKSEREYQTQRAKIARDYAWERYKIERDLNQSLMALGFNTGEQRRGAKTEHDLEAINRRYTFEAAQLRQRANNQAEELAHRTDEEKRALDERQALERKAQADRLRMQREELAHRIAMARQDTAFRRAQLDAQYAHEREIAERELKERIADLEAKAAYDRAQAIEKAAHDKQQAEQQAADRTRQLEEQVRQHAVAEAQKRAETEKRYQEELLKANERYAEEVKAAQDAYTEAVKYVQGQMELEAARHAQVMADIQAEAQYYAMILADLQNVFQNPGAYPNPNIKEDRLPVPGHAEGFSGWVTKPYLFVAGEKGPEYVDIKPMGKQGSGGGSTWNVTINGGNAREIWDDLQPLIQRELRR